MKQPQDYKYYKSIFQNQSFPLAYIDMNMLDENIEAILKRAGKTKIRIASKSVRCTEILRYILDYNPQFEGLMTFTVKESLFLAEQGFDNLLLGYPCVNSSDIEQLILANKAGKIIIPMVDKEEHLQIIEQMAKKHNYVQSVCVDIDMSTHFPMLYFGVYRSSVNSLPKFKQFADTVLKYPNIKLTGIMGYEAQIAGLGDKNPYAGPKNKVIKLLQQKSIKDLASRRKAIYDYAVNNGFEITLVNGGGTGSITSTIEEKHITEVTVGSGFYSPTLFDYYSTFKFNPAAGFALEITRKPTSKIFTLAGGGYVASGSAGKEKLPSPYLPKGVKLIENEGTGEVQTPFEYIGTENLQIGDPILFRHAKAGELCERFNQIHLIKNGKIENAVPTYRGQGQCFL